MVVTATYTDTSTRDVTSSCTWTTEPLNAGTSSVTISYTEGDITETAEQSITVSQIPNTMTLSKSEITLDSTTLSDTFTIEGNYDGEVSVISSDTGVVTVSLSGNVVTVSSVNDTDGVAAITVMASGGNYTAASKTCAVTASFIEDGDYGSDRIAGTKTKGSFVRFDGKDWIVANVSGSTYTLMLKKMTETTQFGSSVTYSGSTIVSKCATFQNTMSANALSVVNSKTVQSVTAKVWIATRSDIISWTDSSEPTSSDWYGMRKWTGESEDDYAVLGIYRYWCSDRNSSSRVWCVNYNGVFNIYNGAPSDTNGFRPCIEVTQ